jgi:hypothetical protein
MHTQRIVTICAFVPTFQLSNCFSLPQAGDLPPPPLVMLATLLHNNRNLLMVENLMAAVWILLRSAANRKVLATAFEENPVLGATLKGQMKVRLPQLRFCCTAFSKVDSSDA